MPTSLMGVDVGFSTTRPTTGIACLEGEYLSLERAGTAWKSREAKIPKELSTLSECLTSVISYMAYALEYAVS
jgi:hypothetical protein